jgi:hypothetical protein
MGERQTGPIDDRFVSRGRRQALEHRRVGAQLRLRLTRNLEEVHCPPSASHPQDE